MKILNWPNTLVMLILLAVIAFSGIDYFGINEDYALDDSFITFRYAENLKNGYGLRFNPDEKYYGSTATGFAVLLAASNSALSLVCKTAPDCDPTYWNMPKTAILISTLSIAGMLLTLFSAIEITLLNRLLLTILATIFFFSFGPLNNAAGHETYTYLFAGLLATTLLFRFHFYFWSALIFVLSFCLRPDSLSLILISLSALATCVYLTDGDHFSYRGLRLFIVTLFTGLVIWETFLYSYYGSFLPGTMDAKKAQLEIFSTYFKPFNLAVVSDYYLRSLKGSLPWLVVLGLSLIGLKISATLFKGLKQRKFEIPAAILMIALVVFANAIGQMVVYLSLNVSFWRWYGIPLVVSSLVLVYYAFSVAIGDLERSSGRLQKHGLLGLIPRFVPAILLLLVICSHFDAYQWWRTHPRVNEHAFAYVEVADYIKEKEPLGASVAIPEPGSFAYRLGPKFLVRDELGLSSPGVAKMLREGVENPATKIWDVDYAICSWNGTYSIACRESLVAQDFEFIGEFDHDFWEKRIGRGLKLYRKTRYCDPMRSARTKINLYFFG